MSEPLSTVRNIGPAMAQRLRRAGVADAAALRALGADAAYRRMLEAGERPHLMAYQALVLGLQGRPFTDLGVDEKQRVQARFAALKRDAQSVRAPVIEAALDALGVVAPRRPGGPGPEAGAPSRRRR